jgi:hypothetical protein
MLQSNITQQRVSVVGEGTLLEVGVTNLLTTRTDLLVSRAIYSNDIAFLDIIKRDRPDVLLVCESGLLDTVRILILVLSPPIVTSLRIVIVRLRTNVIDVYARPIVVEGKLFRKPRRIMVKTEDDLLNAIRRKHNVH